MLWKDMLSNTAIVSMHVYNSVSCQYKYTFHFSMYTGDHLSTGSVLMPLIDYYILSTVVL